MAKSHVKPIGKWKKVSVDHSLLIGTDKESFIELKELGNYKITTGHSATSKNVAAKLSLQKNKKKKCAKNQPDKEQSTGGGKHNKGTGKTGEGENIQISDNLTNKESGLTRKQRNYLKYKALKKERRKRMKETKKLQATSTTSAFPDKNVKPVSKPKTPRHNKITAVSKEVSEVKKGGKSMKRGKMVTLHHHTVDVGEVEMAKLEGDIKLTDTTGKRKQGTCNIESTEQVSKKMKMMKQHQKRTNSQEPVNDGKISDMSGWKNLFVPEPVLRALADQCFTAPTPIQTMALPSAIRDRMDVIGAAETGSGKTLAFGIPVLHCILEGRAQTGTSSISDSGMGESDSDVSDSELDSEDLPMECMPEITELSVDQGHESEEEPSSSAGEDEDDDNDEDEMSDGEEGVVAIPIGGFPVPEDLGMDGSDDEGYDLPPQEEEEIQDVKEGDIDCVRVIKDVSFDWLNDDGEQEEIVIKKKVSGRRRPLVALVLTPTRELAIQVKNHLEAAAKYMDIRIAAIVGGMASQKQERLLQKQPEIIVATPGRLWELMQEGDQHLGTLPQIKCLVIDEADRMVEKGHFVEMTNILGVINSEEKNRHQRQTFVFSATLTLVHSGPDRLKQVKKTKKLSSTQKLESLVSQIGVKDKPKIIDLTRKVGTVETLTEARINCNLTEKDYYLYYFYRQYPGRTLVFANSKDCIRRLVSVLILLECNPLPLHADMHQRQRLKNLDRFKANTHGLLLATDVAARGLDIPDVQHVIHYQVPSTSENYVHRSGRTARASKEGLSVMFVGAEDLKNYRKIIQTLNRDEELPMFPIESEYMPGIKTRVNLARQVDVLEHRVAKVKAKKNWFEKAAQEMEIELEGQHFEEELGDSYHQGQHRKEVKQLRADLKSLLSRPLLTHKFSGKYPTKMGKLVMPYMTVHTSGSALEKVKEEQQRHKRKANIVPQVGDHIAASKKKRRKKIKVKKTRLPKPKILSV